MYLNYYLKYPFFSICIMIASMGSVIASSNEQVVVNKHERQLYLYKNGKQVAAYHIVLGHDPVNPKEREGDSRTPEGLYHITFHTQNTPYTEAMGISYPNAKDRARAKQLGVNPGGGIEIHGYPKSVYMQARLQGKSWTAGCIGLDNHDMKALYQQVSNGTLVRIVH